MKSNLVCYAAIGQTENRTYGGQAEQVLISEERAGNRPSPKAMTSLSPVLYIIRITYKAV